MTKSFWSMMLVITVCLFFSACGNGPGPETKEEVSAVSEFKEKPDEKTAERYIQSGGLWNGGVFAYRLSYVLDRTRELIGFSDYQELYRKYDTLQKISFDYAVVEHEKDISVMRFAGEWKDLGTWNTLTEAMEERSIGDVRFDPTCENVHAINELDIPVLAMGLKDAVISASPEGILVADKHQSSYMKPYVDQIHQPVMFAEKSWGSYRVLDVEKESITVKVTLLPGHGMNYHSHERRDEVWTVVSGTGKTVIDGVESRVKAGETIFLPKGTKHTIIADTELQVIEVQIGEEIDVRDKIKHSY